MARLWSDKTNPGEKQSPGEEGAQPAEADRRQSGSQASPSSKGPSSAPSSTPAPPKNASERRRIRNMAHSRPAAAKILGVNPDGTLQQTAGQQGRARRPESTVEARSSTLEAKKAYRQERARQAREQQQRVAREQAAASATLAAKQAVRREAAASARAREEEPRNALMAKKSLRDDLGKADCTKYVELDKQLLPEVFAGPAPEGEELHPRGGCRGLQEELAATDSEVVMYRECMLQLAECVLGKQRRRLYLTGAPSSGKSIALAALVSTLRARDWLVMYIPQAKQLTHGGFFSRSAEPSMWDTPECAKLVLQYTLAAHPQRAREVRSPSSGRTLEQLAEAALAAPDPVAVVDAFLEAKEAVAAAENAMIAVDNYQALYMPSEYGEWMNNHHRRIIQPQELRVASAMRVLEQPPLRDGVAVCAADRGGSSSSKLRMPMPEGCLFNVPRMNRQEWATMAEFYNAQSISDVMAPATVERAFYLMSGNAREYRKMADLLNIYSAHEVSQAQGSSLGSSQT